MARLPLLNPFTPPRADEGFGAYLSRCVVPDPKLSEGFSLLEQCKAFTTWLAAHTEETWDQTRDRLWAVPDAVLPSLFVFQQWPDLAEFMGVAGPFSKVTVH